MSLIIDEIHAEVESRTSHEGGGEGEARPSEGQHQQSIIDLMELAQERKARLVVD